MQTATPLPLRAVRQINSIPTAKSERAYRHRESHAIVDPVPNRPNFVAVLEHLRESDPLFSQRLGVMRASRGDRSPGHAQAKSILPGYKDPSVPNCSAITSGG